MKEYSKPTERGIELADSQNLILVYKFQESITSLKVKRISHDSEQGIKEFIAEIVSMGRLMYRNLVQLRGYCRRRGELLLVYDYMPNGSLDKLLYNKESNLIGFNVSGF
ncbi:hypothetical protein Dsin_020333 [Dipteronia sinensis]|uniref:Serine-threonine/tyrosine-protein kinase catalytic domain-containing protein n=1 Tax=Dipteronia sinensis TaxID=43782 RepID=A0AAE0A9H6_9ROSI|nr:hypothetical protein Dsin_020333 [Dipteronia sinensis]